MFGEQEKNQLLAWIDAEYDSRAKHVLNGSVKEVDYRPNVQYLKALSDVHTQITNLDRGQTIIKEQRV